MFGVGFSLFNHRNQISPNSLHKAAICRSPRVSLGCAVQGFPWAAESYSIRKSHLVANVILGRAIALSPSSHFHGMWMYDRFHGGYGRWTASCYSVPDAQKNESDLELAHLQKKSMSRRLSSKKKALLIPFVYHEPLFKTLGVQSVHLLCDLHMTWSASSVLPHLGAMHYE